MTTTHLLPWEQLKKHLDMLPAHCFKNSEVVLTVLAVDKALNEYSCKDIIPYINERSMNVFPTSLLTFQFNLLVVVPGWFCRGVLFRLVKICCSRPTFDQYIIRQLIANGVQFKNDEEVEARTIDNIVCHILGGYLVTSNGMYFIHSGTISFKGFFGSARISNTSSKFTAADSAILARYIRLLLPSHDVPDIAVAEFSKSLSKTALMV
jgi:hypothetical protein